MEKIRQNVPRRFAGETVVVDTERFWDDWEKQYKEVPFGLKLKLGKFSNKGLNENDFFESVGHYSFHASYTVYREKSTGEYITRYVAVSNRTKAFIDYFYVTKKQEIEKK